MLDVLISALRLGEANLNSERPFDHISPWLGGTFRLGLIVGHKDGTVTIDLDELQEDGETCTDNILQLVVTNVELHVVPLANINSTRQIEAHE